MSRDRRRKGRGSKQRSKGQQQEGERKGHGKRGSGRSRRVGEDQSRRVGVKAVEEGVEAGN